MAEEELEDDELEDDPTKKRQYPQGQPDLESPSETVGSSAPIGQKPKMESVSAPAVTPAPAYTDPSQVSTVVKPSTLGVQSTPITNTPRPQYHGLNRVLDTIAGTTSIGSAAERAGGFGTQGWDAKNQSEEQQLAEQAGTRQKNAQALNLETAPQRAEDTNQTKENVANITQGGQNTRNAITNQTKENVANTNQTGATTREGMKETAAAPLQKAREDLAEAEAGLAKFKSDPNSPMYKMAQQRMAIAQQSYDLRVKEFGYNYEPSALTPAEQDTLPTDQAGNPVALHSPLKPSAQTVSAAQRATNVVTQLPRLRQEITELQGSLGPVPGRWNQFWQGNVGVADPKFAHLADDMEFAASAMALAHAYGRLPQSISDKFDKMYQAGKQSPENMLAAMDVAQEWMPKIASAGQTRGERAGVSPTNPTAGSKPSASGGGSQTPSTTDPLGIR